MKDNKEKDFHKKKSRKIIFKNVTEELMIVKNSNQKDDNKHYREFRCHVTNVKLIRKHGKPQGSQNTSHCKKK